MKRLIIFILLLCMASAVSAQDTVADPSTGLTTQNILIVGAVIIAALVVLKLPDIFRIMAPLVPADVLKQLIPPVADIALEAAEQTPITLDEAFLTAALRKMGYTVTKDDTGYHTAQGNSTVETNTVLLKSDTESLSAPPTTYTLGDPPNSIGSSSFTSTTTMRTMPPPAGPFGG
jgi:hypothetical protein